MKERKKKSRNLTRQHLFQSQGVTGSGFILYLNHPVHWVMCNTSDKLRGEPSSDYLNVWLCRDSPLVSHQKKLNSSKKNKESLVTTLGENMNTASFSPFLRKFVAQEHFQIVNLRYSLKGRRWVCRLCNYVASLSLGHFYGKTEILAQQTWVCLIAAVSASPMNTLKAFCINTFLQCWPLSSSIACVLSNRPQDFSRPHADHLLFPRQLLSC